MKRKLCIAIITCLVLLITVNIMRTIPIKTSLSQSNSENMIAYTTGNGLRTLPCIFGE